MTEEVPYIFLHRDNVAVGSSPGKLHYSEDNGSTWARELDFAGQDNIQYADITPSGYVLIATQTQFYRSTDELRTITEVIPQNPDGSPFVFHTPVDPSRPGNYFNAGTGPGRSTWVPGRGYMLIMQNYCNVFGGAAPAMLWYTVDEGETLKQAYMFGQNPWYRDNGTDGGGTSGTLLGDPNNLVISRHFHSAGYSPRENVWWAYSGDTDRAGGVFECHWLRGEYDWDQDSWSWEVMHSASEGTIWKSAGVFHSEDGRLRISSDATGGSIDHLMGIYRMRSPVHRFDKTQHTLIGYMGYKMSVFQIGPTLIGRVPANVIGNRTTVYVSNDDGKTWGFYDLTASVGAHTITRFQGPNALGWWHAVMTGTAGGSTAPTGRIFWWKPKV